MSDIVVDIAFTSASRVIWRLPMQPETTRGPKNAVDFELAPGVTVAQFIKWRDAQPPARAEIALMVKRRFEARFIEPVLRDNRVKSGFAAIALCCLAIQALDGFRVGHRKTATANGLEWFFANNPEFHALRQHWHPFYENVRNALHHQAHTTGGWRIHISGPLFDSDAKVIGAQAFVDGFIAALARYCSEIGNSTDASNVWSNFLRRMTYVLEACDNESGES